MKKLLIAAAATAAMLVPAKAVPINFDFSFTSTNPVVGTVTGEVFGLSDNFTNQAATSVEIFSYPSALGLGPTPITLTAPPDMFNPNSFNVSGGLVTSANFAAFVTGSPNFVLSLFTGTNLSSLTNTSSMPNVHTVGTVNFTAVVPGPIVGAGVPGLIAACVGLLALARRHRRKMA
jgi:hypothetical protein